MPSHRIFWRLSPPQNEKLFLLLLRLSGGGNESAPQPIPEQHQRCTKARRRPHTLFPVDCARRNFGSSKEKLWRTERQSSPPSLFRCHFPPFGALACMWVERGGGGGNVESELDPPLHRAIERRKAHGGGKFSARAKVFSTRPIYFRCSARSTGEGGSTGGGPSVSREGGQNCTCAASRKGEEMGGRERPICRM